MLQFIHAADLHLDSPLKGLTRFEGAPVERIQSATRTAFRNLIDLAIERQVAFVLVAGDLWDGEWADAGPALFFLSEVRRLAQAGIDLYAVKGNHDAESRITPLFEWPDHIHFFQHRKPHMLQVPGLPVMIHGQSYAEQHVHDDLSQHYPSAIPKYFNIGMLHTCLEDGSEGYAPACLDSLVKHGYQYWALGHIHDRRAWDRDGIHIEFPGNLQGRSMRETGPKGCTVVTVDEAHTISTEFVALDDVRWLRLEIEADDAELEKRSKESLRNAVKQNGGRLLAVRLVITGTVAQTGQALRERLTGAAVDVSSDVWLERIEAHPRADRDTTAALALDAEVRSLLAEVASDPAVMAELMADLGALRSLLPEEALCHTWKNTEAMRELALQISEEL